ncbi:MAG: glucose-6-phosphate dehydrogenase, partial [Sphingomonas bacterium]|nr:glucose-6-phosphate dehydrogenase [Sphingomonas bacterium]
MIADKVSTLLLFGATGDLAHRMLLPSLYGLHADGLLPPELRIIGTARSELDDAAFRASAIDALVEHVPADFFDRQVAETFVARLSYIALDATQAAGFSRLADKIDPAQGLAIFLSTAPSL